MQTAHSLLLTAGFALLFAGCAAKSDDPGTDATKNATKTAGKSSSGGSESGTVDPKGAGGTGETGKTPELSSGGGEDPTPSKTLFTPAEFKAAKAQMQNFCVSCHGKSGKGDGPGSMALNPKPRDWTDSKWHASVTDQQIFDVIKDGGAKHGLSPLMGPNPQFQDKPGAIHALVKMIRRFKGK